MLELGAAVDIEVEGVSLLELADNDEIRRLLVAAGAEPIPPSPSATSDSDQ